MNYTNSQNAEKALKITTLLTLIIAGFEFFSSCQSYQTGMNLLDIASYANENLSMYCLVVNVNIKMYKFLKIRMYKSVHFYFQLFPFFSFASINLSFNL